MDKIHVIDVTPITTNLEFPLYKVVERVQVDVPEKLACQIADGISFCNGICGTAVLEKGILTYNPFVAVGFNVAGVDKTSGEPEAADASAWGGVCITYASEIAPTLQLGLGDFDKDIGYANPARSLTKSTGKTVCFEWFDFKQPSWYKGNIKIDGPTAAKRLVSLEFLMQHTPGAYKFKICAIGPYGGSIPSTCDLTD